jgi:glycerol-3-phosphate cytidylyltransferase
MRLGFTCGSFDLLHAGHILMLEECKRFCDKLVVGLQTDPTLDRPEKNQPVQSVFERWIQLEAVKYVGQIIPYDTENDLRQLLLSLMPDVRFVSDEYREKPYTGQSIKDIEIHYNKRKHHFSSTQLRERCRDSAK